MWKLRNIKWWLQISIFIPNCSLHAILPNGNRHHFISHSSPASFCAKMKMFSHRTSCLVKLKTYKSFKSCYVEPQEFVWRWQGLQKNFPRIVHTKCAHNGLNPIKHLSAYVCFKFSFFLSLLHCFFPFRAYGNESRSLLAFKIKLISKLNTIPLSS